MSAGEFVSAIYETDAGNFCNIRVQPETLAASVGASANASGAGPVNQEASAIARKGKRQPGVGARTVTVDFAGAGPAGYDSESLIIPIMTPTVFASATLGTTVTYLGATGVVVGRSSEDIG